jgi:hypothetical protein
VIGGFQFAVWFAFREGFMVEAAVGEWSAEAFVEEQEEQRDVNALGGQAVSIAAPIALQQAVPFELAQIVAELIQFVAPGRNLESSDDGLMDLAGGPAADRASAMEEDFQEANDAGVMDFDSRITY